MASQSSTTLDFINVLRRRRWIVLQTAIVVPLLALLLSATQSDLYEGRTRVALDREGLADALTGVSSDPGVDEFNQILNREAVVAKSASVADQVAKQSQNRFRGPSFFENTTVEVDEQASLLVFGGRAADARSATQLSSLHAEAYLANRRDLAARRYRQAVADLDAQIAALEDQGDSSAALRESLDEERQRLQLFQALASAQGSIVDTSDPEKVRPKPIRNVVLGVILGAIIGALLAFVVEAFDRRLRRVEDVEMSVGLRLLGQIPELGRRTAEERLVMRNGDPLEAVDAFRALRASVDLAMSPDTKIVLVSSSGPREGKTTVACNLAAAFAMSGHGVALVDLDLRHSTASQVLGIGDAAGISDLIVDGGELDDLLLTVPLPASPHAGREGLLSPRDRSMEDGAPGHRLQVLPAGRYAGMLADTVSFGPLAEHLHALAAANEIVIVDAPPLFDAATVELTEHVDALLLVARLGVVDRGAMSEARRLLSMSPAPALGMVVTSADLDPDGRVASYSPVPRSARRSTLSFK